MTIGTEATDAEVRIFVDDDGRWREGGSGRGVNNMRRRAQALGGRLEVEGSPAGTTLSLWLPRGQPGGSTSPS